MVALGKLSHSDLDQRALDALKEFPPDGALGVLTQFLESNLAHVSNKSAFLCGVMKTYRAKSRGGGGGSGSNATGNGSLATGSTGSGSTNGGLVAKGPDEEKIKVILERTGYKLDVTTGQRKYGGPPPDWEGDPPASGCEVSYSIFYMRAFQARGIRNEKVQYVGNFFLTAILSEVVLER
jgi:heterogeneous nuclear ribonucleoprotein R